MTRRDWWLGVAAIVGVILLHALVPRYEWRNTPIPMRVDRWLGRVEAGQFDASGRWRTRAYLLAAAEQARASMNRASETAAEEQERLRANEAVRKDPTLGGRFPPPASQPTPRFRAEDIGRGAR